MGENTPVNATAEEAIPLIIFNEEKRRKCTRYCFLFTYFRFYM